MMTEFDIARLPYEERLHWQKRKDWPQGFSTHTAAGIMFFLWFFAFAWCGLTGFIFFVNAAKIRAAMSEGVTGWIVPGAVALLGLIAVVSAVNTTIFWLRFGRTTLRIQSLPAFTGETFRGELQAGSNIIGRRPFKATLQCEEVRQKLKSVGRGFAKRRKHDHFIREMRGLVTAKIDRAPEPGDSGSVLAIEIEIPRGSPGSLHRDNGTGYQWTLILMSDDGRTPVFSAAFEVPVYRREDLEPA